MLLIIHSSPDGSVVSVEKNSSDNNSPLFTAKKHTSGTGVQISFFNLNFCSVLLHLAKEKKLSETRSCLESMQFKTFLNVFYILCHYIYIICLISLFKGNMDPIMKILGDAYATVDRKDNTMNRLLDQMMKVNHKKFAFYFSKCLK